MVDKGRWQRPFRTVIVTHSGPLTHDQQLLAALITCGEGAVLGGLAAAGLDGMIGYDGTQIDVLVPEQRNRRPAQGVVLHRSRFLTSEAVHPLRLPPRTRLPRSLVDAASWASTDLRARAILAAGVQQRLARPGDLREVVETLTRLRRRSLILETINDVEGGSHSTYELDFLRMCRRFHLPLPDRQVRRADTAGRSRYLDSEFDAYKLVVEIDGMQHMEVHSWWADLLHVAELQVEGRTVLRYPGFIVRHQPEVPAAHIGDFMRRVDRQRRG